MNSLAQQRAFTFQTPDAVMAAASVSMIARALSPTPPSNDVFGVNVATAAATRAALGLPQAYGADRCVAEEALAAHARRILVLWPRALGWTPPSPPPAGDLAGLSRALFGQGGMPRSIDDFEAWLDSGRSLPARCLGVIWRRWDARWGRAAAPLLGPRTAIRAVDWRRAEIDGDAVENTAASRLADCDLMRGIEARRGRGIAWRLAAQLSDCARLLDALNARSDFDDLCAPAPGVGAASVASGTLFVRVTQGEDAFTHLEQLTPLDCAAHHRGILWRSGRFRPGRARRRPPGFAAMLRYAAGCHDGAAFGDSDVDGFC